MQGQVDIIDILLKLVIFATFVIFGIAMLLIKKQKKEKEKQKQDETEKSSQIPND
jgi:mannitol-specific phosphotransferase system IIBC component